MLQYIILGYLIYEILRLAQQADVSAVKFVPPASEPSVRSTATAIQPPSSAPPVASPQEPKSEVATAKSG